MHGVDGNYLKMQGEILTRLQVAYQADQTAQQTRAQAQGQEALRQLREQVEVATKMDARNQPSRVDRRKEGQPSPRQEREASWTRTDGPEVDAEKDGPPPEGAGPMGHIDLRI